MVSLKTFAKLSVKHPDGYHAELGDEQPAVTKDFGCAQNAAVQNVGAVDDGQPESL